MTRLVNITPTKTYANEKNAVRAVEKIFGPESELRYVMMRTEENRVFPLFIGNSAIMAGVHFHFNVVN